MSSHHLMIIGDQRVDTTTRIEVRSPYDGRLLGTVAEATTDHLDRAVDTAKTTLAAGVIPTHERAAILDRLAASLTDHHEELAQTISTEAAKPITIARGEAARAVDTVRFAAAVARTMTGELITMDASSGGVGKTGWVKRIPIGVLGAITPFNFPLNLVCHKIAPAIAAGCPVVLKPADKTPLSAIRLGELLLDECGLPPGWLNVVPCYGPTAAHLAEHPDVAMITFTGSAADGWQIRANAPRKRVSLELGNNSPVIIEPDTDIATTAARIKGAAFGFTGQVCISTQRIYVHEDIATEFTKALVAETDSLVIGDPADEATEISALINSDATERIVTWISEAVAAGVVIECGGEVGDNGILSPTVLSGITADMKVSCAEVFGPVVGIATYTDFEDALARANDTIYGLHAAVFTKDIAKALRAADVLDFAGVLVNEVPTWRADHMPYGGIRESGNTREGPVYAVQEMTEERLIVIQA